MAQNELYTAMNQIEEYLYQGFSVFGGCYRLVKKSDLYNKCRLLYESLPQELVDNKELLSRQKEENIFSLLNRMNIVLDQFKTFWGFILVDVNTITSILDKMYASLPDDIKICRGNDNIVANDAEQIAIPDFLKKNK